ncbi:predicted protein [Chaetoceros tenuissimus]|uniref:Uncharacterized protein n=1 Tax=Chaetoceros tenuissimus TaxID=426638 RepID=A0AAD3CNM7_9STRA|nr:predicted protein [Chaetoceros tenuissimus]
MTCVKICKSYTKIGFKNHPTVTGTSNNWLIANSSRKEANAALRKAEAMETKCKELSDKYLAAEKDLVQAKKDATRFDSGQERRD